ncbi:integrin alpha-L-like isoform X2 [Hypomesus transpacificus]|uniref:integrin alpha-L-like isoform X2 n=2 Tax=Hypomesus transpacificus TaxID=137520 RepID=UPI001F0818A8|nr:integrin alpha-L-like isoform X2 [Hypomesus transpacificus]
MTKRRLIPLLTCMATIVLSASWAFNIDVANPHICTGKKQDLFDYKVVQYISGKKGIRVTVPLQKSSTGGICKCVQNQTVCYNPAKNVALLPNGDRSLEYIGLTLGDDLMNPPNFVACSPGLVHECDENSHLNSVCYKFNSEFQKTSNFTPAFQECTKKKVDLVFLFDGSESMSRDEFNKNKGFILDIIKLHQKSSIKFAAVQFSKESRTVFDFNDYQKGTAEGKLRKEQHFQSLTNTHKAIDFVLKNLFDNSIAGATPDATKVLVIITDGLPTDSDRNLKSIKRTNEKNIIRFIIGVKNPSNKNNYNVDFLEKLKKLASEPKDNNTFLIEDYNGLSRILDIYQKKTFKVYNTAWEGNLRKDMSQSGFNSQLQEDILVLGSVGLYEWRGSLSEIQGPGSEKREIVDPSIEKDSYMGYALTVAKKNDHLLYLTGAPSFEHKGQILLFTNDENNDWEVTTKEYGEQIGSYFGAELSAVDIDSDGNTDFLLVAAPMFYQSQSEGKIYVYQLTDKLELRSVMNVSGPFWGRFGSSISSVTDLNGDDLKDVAVGAPLEDEGRGAVYIYLGDKLGGIRKSYNQRIAAKMLRDDLELFGQTLDGRMDMGHDGLIDIAVGAKGRVVVLRSKSVFNVSAGLSFHPSEISTDPFDCLTSEDQTFPVFTITACFSMVEATKSGVRNAEINVSYMLEVDPMRHTSRGLVGRNGTRGLQMIEKLSKNVTCFNHSIHMKICVKDTLSPVVIKLTFSQNSTTPPTGILNVDSPTKASIEVPFTKNCENKEKCVAELEVNFNFTTSTLIVMDQSYFNVTVRLSNHADDSHNTSLTFLYPPGLSFSKMHLEKATRTTLHKCSNLEGVTHRTLCSISLPVYRSKTTATFKSLFRISNSYNWNDTMSMTIIGHSDNDNSTNATVTKSIPVQFAVDLTAKANYEYSNTYFIVNQEDKGLKNLVNVYEVKNLAWKSLPVTVTITFPTLLGHQFEMRDYKVSVSENQTECKQTINATSDYCTKEKNCKSIKCNAVILDKNATVQFKLRGSVSFEGLEQLVKDMPLSKMFTGDEADVRFKSFVNVDYDKQRYVQKSSNHENKHYTSFHQAQIDVRAEFIIPPNKELIIATGAGGGVLLLLIITVVMFKMGCFNSKMTWTPGKEEIDDGEENYGNGRFKEIGWNQIA